MNIVRLATASVPAIGVTGALLLSMHILIASNFEEPKEGEEFKIPDIVMPKREVSNNKTKPPEPPPETEEPPPELPEPEFADPDVNVDIAVAVSTSGKMDIGGIGGFKVAKVVQPKGGVQEQGVVRLKVCVDASGRVIPSSIKYAPDRDPLTTTNLALRQRAIDALRQFKFTNTSGSTGGCGFIKFTFKLK